MILETEICRKHVKQCSGSVENAATETWETVMNPLTETRVCRCVFATESRVSTMFKFTDTWFFVLWMKQQKIGKPSKPSGGLGRELLHLYPSPDSLARFARRFSSLSPPTSEPGPRPLCITHKLIGDIHSSLLLFITCKLHQKQSGKGTLSIVGKRSLKIPERTA